MTARSKKHKAGPVSGPMLQTVEALHSSYPDTFDWTVYDRLHARFGESQPRGGVVFKSPFKLVNFHTSCSKCHYAFEIDAYGRGCVHECAYCYAKDQLTTHGFWNRPMPFPMDVSLVRKVFYTVFETQKPSKWRAVMEKRIPLRIGSMSDSFMWMDLKYKVTQELLKILNYYKYPYIIFTRSDLVAHETYLKLLDRKLAAVQVSMSGDHEVLSRRIEPGAPSPQRRLKALLELNRAGIWTTVRLNPFFPTHPDGYFTRYPEVLQRFGSEDRIPTFPWFEWEFLDRLKEARVPSVLAGVVRLSSKAINTMSRAAGINMKDLFDPTVLQTRGDKHYSDEEIAYYYSRLSHESKKRGIRFNTCYIGNGLKDYYQYQHHWSNPQDCCDAKGNVAAFVSSSQWVPWTIREKHAPNKKICATAKDSEALIEQQPRTDAPVIPLPIAYARS